MPFNPKRPVTGPCTVAPSLGEMKYTSASAAGATRSCATANAAINVKLSARSTRFMRLSFEWISILQLQHGIHEYPGQGDEQYDHVHHEKCRRLDQNAGPA